MGEAHRQERGASFANPGAGDRGEGARCCRRWAPGWAVYWCGVGRTVLGWLLWVIVVAEMVCGVEGEFWFGSGWAVTLSR
jgi:hypothetical protein